MEGIAPIFSYVWTAIAYIAPFLFLLGIVVFVHEFGHFIIGRLCGAEVKVFSLGMGKEIIGLTDRHGTRWRLSAIPLGGYVKFAGDRNAVSAPDAAALAAMTDAERRASLAGQPLLRRAAIVAAGPVANFLLGIIIFAGLAYVLGETTLSPRIDKIVPDSPAERAGFQKGDIVRSIDGEPIASFSDIFRIVSVRSDEVLTILVERDGREVTRYRKVHLPGHADHEPDRPFQHLERRYFDPGPDGFVAHRAFGGIVGLAICNDRRWPETYRLLGLQGVELVLIGYNTPIHYAPDPGQDRLAGFHNNLVMAAGAYQNGTWVVGAAKGGIEEGVESLADSQIIAPSGEVVARAATDGDEVVLAACDLDACADYQQTVFDFERYRMIEHYGPIAAQRGVVAPPDGETGPEQGRRS
jgi:predicted amidohydrolase